MSNIKNESRLGFTLVELLIVIFVIAILAAITIVGFNGIQNRANDTKRVGDIANIKKAIMNYNTLNGGVLKVGSYSTINNTNGWDVSTNPDWLKFLRSSNGTMPSDPVNTLANNDPPTASNLVYYYYCYDETPARVRVGYHKSDGTQVATDITVDSCK